MTRNSRIAGQAGFTLVELLTVVLIIGALAAIALPMFVGERAKGQDAVAKADARTIVSALESCYTDSDEYDACPDGPTGVTIGSGPGEVDVTAAGDEYEIVARSVTGNTFTVVKNPDATVTRSCSAAGTPKGGCDGGAW